MASRLEILWALVVLQGAILLTTTVEAAFLGFVLGGGLAIPAVLTATAAVVTLLAARGLRRQRRWARRVLLIGEWFVIAFGALEVVATVLLAQTPPDLVPVVTGILIPATVLWLLRSVKGAFTADTPAVPATTQPADDPILGTL
jgi:hypothetical protein